jgi:hypothetical protein
MRELLTKKQLRERLNLRSTRMIDYLVAKRKIPVLRFGRRTIRFDWDAVVVALGRLEIQEIARR